MQPSHQPDLAAAAAWLRAEREHMGLTPKVFAHTMLGFYDPITHDLLFGPPEPANDRGRKG